MINRKTLNSTGKFILSLEVLLTCFLAFLISIESDFWLMQVKPVIASLAILIFLSIQGYIIIAYEYEHYDENRGFILQNCSFWMIMVSVFSITVCLSFLYGLHISILSYIIYFIDMFLGFIYLRIYEWKEIITNLEAKKI